MELKMQKLVVTLLFVLISSYCIAAEDSVKEFTEKGVMVDIQNFFKDAKNSNPASDKKKLQTSYLAFVNEKGVYSFLERDDQEKLLNDIKIGDHVEIKGKILDAGFLVEIETIKKLEEKSTVDLKKYQDTDGKATTLEGTNKCQCGLKVGTLQHNCKLGHLHHLQTEDGKIYHYLDADKSADMKIHFKKLKLDVLLFPGNFIKIKEPAK
jgi:L-ascorbate metabolism protein UlaG (beta-lactamase superfamily)